MGRRRYSALGVYEPLSQRVPPGLNFVPTLLGAVLLWDFFTRVMQGVTMTFFEDVWSRNFLNLFANLFASPLRISEYLAGLVMSSIVTSLLAFAAGLALVYLFMASWFFSRMYRQGAHGPNRPLQLRDAQLAKGCCKTPILQFGG
jgi:hypothetical protein